MNTKGIEFATREAKEMAVFLAELERQGVTYRVNAIGGGWIVTLEGGF